MRSCEAIYGPEQADAIEELVVAATGDTCPCRKGGICPLLDGDRCNLLAEITPPPPVSPVASLNLKIARTVRGGGLAGESQPFGHAR